MQEANRFSDIISNFKLIQSANAELEEELKSKEKENQYRRWKAVKCDGLVSNCIISPDGRTVYHAKNGDYCNCGIDTDYPFVWEHINPTHFGYN